VLVMGPEKQKERKKESMRLKRSCVLVGHGIRERHKVRFGGENARSEEFRRNTNRGLEKGKGETKKTLHATCAIGKRQTPDRSLWDKRRGTKRGSNVED